MIKLPAILAAEFGADYVEDIPCDVRRSNLTALNRIIDNPDSFPNANWTYLHKKHAAILSIPEWSTARYGRTNE